ncbi:MAG TPA: hypothetical protein VMU15_21455 [Anaeromyxobacter sp.]|nr:hypothetical protein [Anaeromyxobacter sp.]
MPGTPWLHAAVDELAVWLEDRRRRDPSPFVPAPPAPLACFGPLPPPPPAPAGPGWWTAPSPRPAPGDGQARALVTRAAGPRRGTAVLVPPWKVPRLSLLSGWTSLLEGLGLEVWTLIPPFHLDRAPPGLRSGEAFATPDLPALRAAVEQLVLEVRLLLGLARGQGGELVLVGLSLGALAAALAATSAEAPDRLVAVAPPADLLAVATRTGIGRRYRALGARAGRAPPPLRELEPMLRPFRPEARALRAPRALVATGSADAIALPGPATDLARAWGAELRIYPRGHLTLLFWCRALRRDVARFVG